MGLKPETTSGGNALKFYASQRIDIRRNMSTKTTNDAGEMTGNKTTIKVVKNKIAPPFREVEVDIEFGKGFSKYSSLLNMATKLKVIEKAGSWYAYNNTKLGQGAANVIALLENDIELATQIKDHIDQVVHTGELPF